MEKKLLNFLKTKTGNFYEVPKKVGAKDKLKPITKKEFVSLYRKKIKNENIDISEEDIKNIILNSNIPIDEIVAFEAKDINEQWHWTVNKEYALENYNINENTDLKEWNKKGFKEVFKKPKPVYIAPLTVEQIKKMNFKYNSIDMSIPKDIKEKILNNELNDNEIPGVLAQNPKNEKDIWFIPIETFIKSYDIKEEYFNNIKKSINFGAKLKTMSHIKPN